MIPPFGVVSDWRGSDVAKRVASRRCLTETGVTQQRDLDAEWCIMLHKQADRHLRFQQVDLGNRLFPLLHHYICRNHKNTAQVASVPRRS
jgi:hypothetical protein